MPFTSSFQWGWGAARLSASQVFLQYIQYKIMLNVRSGGPLFGPLHVVLQAGDLFTFHEASICDWFRLDPQGTIFV